MVDDRQQIYAEELRKEAKVSESLLNELVLASKKGANDVSNLL